MPLAQASDLIRIIDASPLEGLNVIWMAVPDSREPLRAELEDRLAERPALVLVIRSRGFDDPNALLADFVGLLNQHRRYCEDRLANFAGSSSLNVILLAKKTLGMSQASSPVELPSWLPIMPGVTTQAVLHDRTWTTACPVNDQRAGIKEIHEGLHALEGSMLRRLRARVAADHRSGDAFHSVMHDPPGSNFETCLAEFMSCHSSVANPSSFRPSLRESRSLIAHIWKLLQQNGTEKIGRPAEKLTVALGVTDEAAEKWRVGFVGLLFRPTGPPTPRRILASDLVTTIALSCQLTTAAAHADSYPAFPVPLLTSFGHALQSSISQAIQLIDSLD